MQKGVTINGGHVQALNLAMSISDASVEFTFNTWTGLLTLRKKTYEKMKSKAPKW